MTPARALVVAAHPDDEVLGCGGTIARLRDADLDVRVCFLAEGVTSRYDAVAIETPEVLAESKRRNDNALRALDILAVPADQVFLSDRPCCRLDLVPQLDLVKHIEEHIADFQPDTVYCHAADDVNIDHRLAHQAVLAAARPVGGNHPTAIYCFEVLSSTEWNPARPFPAVSFIDISQTLERKIEALAAYEDEMRPPPHPRSPEVVRALATLRGAQAGVRHAEGFSVLRTVE